MIISIETGPDFHQTVTDLGQLGQKVSGAVSKGLEKGGQLAAGTVVRDYLSGQSLKRRSGLLSRELNSWMNGPFETIVGIDEPSPAGKYKWLLGDDQMTIRPRTAKFLSIPIGEGLTPSGVPRYSSPREVTGGFFIESKGKLLFGNKRGARGRFRPLFVLVRSVFVQGSGALLDGVTDSLPDITKSINTEITRIKGIDK